MVYPKSNGIVSLFPAGVVFRLSHAILKQVESLFSVEFSLDVSQSLVQKRGAFEANALLGAYTVHETRRGQNRK